MTRGRARQTKINDELKNELVGITMMGLSFFVAFSLWYGSGKNNIPSIGTLGGYIYRVITTLFGNGKYLFPLIIFFMGLSKLWFRLPLDKLTMASWTGLFAAVLSLLHLFLPVDQQTLTIGWSGLGGGISGALVTRLLLTLFGRIGAFIVLATVIVASLLGLFKKPFRFVFKRLLTSSKCLLSKLRLALADLIFEEEEEDDEREEQSRKEFKHVTQTPANPSSNPIIIDHTAHDLGSQQETFEPSLNLKSPLRLVKEKETPDKKDPEKKIVSANLFMLPTKDMLQFPTKIKSQRLNKDITDKVRTLEETLENFGVKAKVTQVSRGPSITRYEIQPPPGIKVSRIVNLADDIALSLAVAQVRIEAPIPGKAAVGVEVPNEEIAIVTLREVLETDLFQASLSKLTVALGKDIAGNPIVADLAKMPHLLIAGATGAGKSVCINAIIASILFKSTPDEVKLLMIDPKVVELSNFNGIPHLISPVVTEPKKAATSLRWIVHEMENRYELFASLGVKDIFRYNQARVEETDSQIPLMPYIVVLIDELADLMMVAPADVEDAICRLAQMARAAGIHLVVATQRPSVDVITGVIKANIPSRIAFAVSSQTDSRTILDMGGAERLMGRGDMLYYPTGMAKPTRVQGVFVSDQEIDRLVEYLKVQKDPEYLAPWPSSEAEVHDDQEDDALLSAAARIFIEGGQASISMLQRRLRIGYTRAARIIDQLESKGIVGGYEGSKPRNILMTWEDYEKTFGGSS